MAAMKSSGRRRKRRVAGAGKTRKKPSVTRRARRNPRSNHHMQGAVKMSAAVKSVVYNNAFSSTPSRSFQHKFGPNVSMYALQDGSILIKGRVRLWDTFTVEDKV